MNNIIYTVLLFNLLIILFKLFDKYNVDNLQALTVNYATASIFCYYFLLDNKNINQIINQPWFNSTFFRLFIYYNFLQSMRIVLKKLELYSQLLLIKCLLLFRYP